MPASDPLCPPLGNFVSLKGVNVAKIYIGPSREPSETGGPWHKELNVELPSISLGVSSSKYLEWPFHSVTYL
jgi:hypothetical protein